MADEPLTSIEFKRELDARDERLRRDMDAREERLRRYYDVQTEKLRDDIHKLSDGYIAGFERLGRELAETRRDWNAKFQLHEDVLKNHSTRITALEARKRS